MSHAYTHKFSRKGPDVLAEELARVMCGQPAFEFKPLFTIVHANLRARNACSGGEEMLRLRVYEKLQSFVSKGMVTKTTTAGIKEYLGLATLSAALPLVVAPPVVV